MDDPALLVASDTPIPKNTDPPLEVVAITPDHIAKVKIVDRIQQYVELLKGPDDNLEFVCLIAGGGVYEKNVYVKKGSRLSLRSLEGDEINTGRLFIEFGKIL